MKTQLNLDATEVVRLGHIRAWGGGAQAHNVKDGRRLLAIGHIYRAARESSGTVMFDFAGSKEEMHKMVVAELEEFVDILKPVIAQSSDVYEFVDERLIIKQGPWLEVLRKYCEGERLEISEVREHVANELRKERDRPKVEVPGFHAKPVFDIMKDIEAQQLAMFSALRIPKGFVTSGGAAHFLRQQEAAQVCTRDRALKQMEALIKRAAEKAGVDPSQVTVTQAIHDAIVIEVAAAKPVIIQEAWCAEVESQIALWRKDANYIPILPAFPGSKDLLNYAEDDAKFTRRLFERAYALCVGAVFEGQELSSQTDSSVDSTGMTSQSEVAQVSAPQTSIIVQGDLVGWDKDHWGAVLAIGYDGMLTVVEVRPKLVYKQLSVQRVAASGCTVRRTRLAQTTGPAFWEEMTAYNLKPNGGNHTYRMIAYVHEHDYWITFDDATSSFELINKVWFKKPS